MNFFYWVEHHGGEAIAICWIFSSVISVMPPLPEGSGFFRTWIYRILQMISGSLDKLVRSTPFGNKLESINQTNTKTTLTPDTVTQEISKTSINQ